MGLIKDVYSKDFYERFARSMQEVLPSFDGKKFVKAAMGNGFETMEWKDRMKHTTKALHHFMPADFKKAAKLLIKSIPQLRKDGHGNFPFMFYPDYIETYGLKDFDTSVKAFETITQFISCEFAVRPFILQYGNEMIGEMLQGSTHKSEHVRRLASEGSRPRLPWAMALPALKTDPSPILPILENLKNDPSEYVRRSVANNLNDIAKDHPDLLIAIAAKWKGVSKETDALVKHASRTLLKQGHAEILKQYGLSSKNISITEFRVLTPKIRIGDYLEFDFTITNHNKKKQMVRLEYAVYYQKSKGHLAKKVYKISEREFKSEEECSIARRQSFKQITTRVFHKGLHQVAIVVNGEEKSTLDFQLV